MTTPAKPPDVEPAFPNPPRFRWLKRVLLLIAVVIAGVTLLRLWWGHEARRRLQAEIDAIHARGEPILIEDFGSPGIPNNQNAAWYLQQAAAAYVPSQAENVIWHWDKPVSAAHMALFQQFLSSNQQLLHWARAARDYPRADWGTKLTHRVFRVLLPNLSSERAITNSLSINTFVLHRENRDAEAIEAIRDLMHQSNAVSQDTPALVTNLTSIGMNSMASDAALGIAPDLQIDASSSTTRPSGPASRAQVIALIQELLDETEYQRGGIAAFYGGRLAEYDYAHSAASILRWNSGIVNFVQPLGDLEAVRIMKISTAASIAIGERSYPAAIASIAAQQQIRPHSILRDFDILGTQVTFMSSFNQVLFVHFRVLTNRRAAALALAIRLWQIDHAGASPLSLDALVPDYLIRIPLDPFAADGSPFRYKLLPQRGPIFYSVGENGVDDGGSEMPPKSNSRHLSQDDRNNRLDIVYHVLRAPSTTQPSTMETGDDNSNE